MSPRARTPTPARRRRTTATKSAAKSAARKSAATRTGAKRAAKKKYVCPDCGATFDRPQSLGAHRRQAHGVVGNSKRSQSRARSAGQAAPARAGGRGVRTRSQAPTAAARTTATARSDGASARRPRGGSAGADRDNLLRALFPSGIPARVEVIRAVNDWLDQADRLTQMA